MSVFNAVRPTGYPHIQRDFVVSARLSGGLGDIQFFVEIHDAATSQLVHVSSTFELNFPDRDTTVELAVSMPTILFAHDGVYAVELHMNNQWVCDTILQLL